MPNGFDVGLGFGGPGIGQDQSDIHDPVSFTISNTANNLTLDDIATDPFGARMTSIGSPTGERNYSSKLTVTSPAAPDAKCAVIASPSSRTGRLG